MNDIKEQLRKRARSYRRRAGYSLALIVLFIGIAVYIFYFASSISNVSTQNSTVIRLQNELEQANSKFNFADSLNKVEKIRLLQLIDALNKDLDSAVYRSRQAVKKFTN